MLFRSPDFGLIHQELKRAGVTLMLLWEEYGRAHPEGATYQYTQFTERYPVFAAGLKRSMRQIHRAGEKLFVDYAGPNVPIWDEQTGAIAFAAQIFVAVLGANYADAIEHDCAQGTCLLLLCV